MLKENQIKDFRDSIGDVIQIRKGESCIENVIISFSENDEEIRLNLDNGYIVLNKETLK